LTHLRICDCTIVPGEHIDLSSLALRVSICSLYFDRTHFANLWMSLLSPQLLRELHVQGHGFRNTTMPPIMPFPCVQKLKLGLDIRRTQNRAFLDNFSAVQVLSVVDNFFGGLEDPSPHVELPAIFPILREYTGTSEMLHGFMPRSTLTRLTIDNCNPRELQGLMTSTSSNNIITLSVSFRPFADAFDNPEFDSLCALFPQPTDLRITIWPDMEDDGTITPQVRLFHSFCKFTLT
jgi:hypothetical protein